MMDLARRLRPFFLAAAATIVFMLFWLGAKPIAVNLFPEPWDKLAHFVTYGTLAVLIGLGLAQRKPLAVIFLVALIGALDEWHQVYLPGRSPGIDDWLADFTAAIVATVALEWLRLRGSLGQTGTP